MMANAAQTKPQPLDELARAVKRHARHLEESDAVDTPQGLVIAVIRLLHRLADKRQQGPAAAAWPNTPKRVALDLDDPCVMAVWAEATPLRRALGRHAGYVSDDDDLTTVAGLVWTTVCVLDRIADDRPENQSSVERVSESKA